MSASITITGNFVCLNIPAIRDSCSCRGSLQRLLVFLLCALSGVVIKFTVASAASSSVMCRTGCSVKCRFPEIGSSGGITGRPLCHAIAVPRPDAESLTERILLFNIKFCLQHSEISRFLWFQYMPFRASALGSLIVRMRQIMRLVVSLAHQHLRFYPSGRVRSAFAWKRRYFPLILTQLSFNWLAGLFVTPYVPGLFLIRASTFSHHT